MVSRKIFSDSLSLLSQSLAHAFVCSLSPVFLAWHCVFSLLSVVASGISWHAGGWQLCKKPCVLSFSASSRLVFEHDDMCLVISDSLRGRSFNAMLTYEGPASLVNLFFTHFLSVPHAQFSTISSGYAWARSKCVTSWCVECTFQDWWRTIHTNILNTDLLCRVCFVHLRG